MSARHRLFLASAGTGKTYQLTGHFLGLLLAGVPPARILATTFTRKAAGEILDRVLERLVQAAEDEGKLTELRGQVQDLAGPVTAADCRALLARLVGELDRFQVRTLDSFFVQVGRLFAHDLGLPAGWTLADESEEESMHSESLARLVEDLPPEEMIELLRGSVREGAARRSVYRGLLQVVRTGRDVWLDSVPGAWERVRVPAGLEPGRLEELALAVQGLEVPLTKSGKPDSRFRKAFDDLEASIREGDWDAAADKGVLGKFLDGKHEYYRVPFGEDLEAILEELARQVSHVQLGRVDARTRAHAHLLGRFEEVHSALERERGTFGFSDLPRALVGADGASPIEERGLDLAFRLDGRIDHLLLDEFQDTAPIQWRVLERLAEEILATHDGTRSFFCVGDVKQSIYGFRSAEPRLLASLGGWYGIEQEPLDRSYRSSPVVIDTVNRIFTGLHSARPVLGDGSASGGEDRDRAPQHGVQEWLRGFRPHETARTEPGACVLIESRACGEEEGEADVLLELTVERVKALCAEAPGATIGVLVRTNGPIPRLVRRLLAEGIGASEEGGNPLTDSRAVLALLSLLHLADHPGDSVAAFHVQQSALARVVLERGGERVASFHPAAVSRFLREWLLEQGLGPFCAAFLDAVLESPDHSEWDRRRYRRAVDLAFAWGPRLGLRADEFARHLRRHRVEDPAASRVKVMTVHGSKGLEFDAVVLPELNRSLAGDLSRGLLFQERTDPRRPFERVVVGASRAARLDADLEQLAFDTRAREMGEALSILYVALTRARRRLELLVPPATNLANLTYANLLRAQLGVPTPEESASPEEPPEPGEPAERPDPVPAGGVLWRHPASSDDWAAGLGAAEVRALPVEPVLHLAAPRGPRELPARAPSHHGAGGVTVDQLLARPAREATEHGTAVHEALARVEWLESGALPAQLVPAGAVAEALERALGHAAVREALTPPPLASGEGLEVWRERPFSLVLEQDGSEVLVSGAFDRVVLVRDGQGRPLRAEILDFKTDRVEGPELAARCEFYRPQLERYRDALAAMTGLAPERIALSLLFLHAGERREL